MDPELATSLEVEAMVRRYLGKVARRYIPLVVALVVLLLVVTLVPTVSPKSQLANQAFGPNAIANSTGPGATVPGATANTSASTVAGAAGETWWNVDRALRVGSRGLPGRGSLARLLGERRPAPRRWRRWTAREDALVRVLPPAEAARRTGRPLPTVYARRRTLRLLDARRRG